MRFRRALDRRNVTEALSAASELQFVGLAEALELTLLLADGEDPRYERAALRWHARFVYETKNVDIRESVAVLALLTAIPANRLSASALAELFSRRRVLSAAPRPLSAGHERRRPHDRPVPSFGRSHKGPRSRSHWSEAGALGDDGGLRPRLSVTAETLVAWARCA
jgi:hypothetical protein